MADDRNFAWETFEYSHTPKKADWFWAVGIISLGCVVTAFIFGNALFGLVILISSFTLIMYAARAPSLMNVVVNEMGIQVGKYIYPYSEIASFWIAFYAKETKLLIRSKKTLAPLVSLSIPHEIHVEELRDFLNDRIKEEELHEPIFQHLLEYLGF